MRHSDWAHIGPPETNFVDERDCGVAGTERDMAKSDMCVFVCERERGVLRKYGAYELGFDFLYNLGFTFSSIFFMDPNLLQ